MAKPTLVFNSGTGSDTTASGSQGVISATGTAASFSGNVVSLDGTPDLSGFVADDDILWLQTDSGRQFFDLVSVVDGVSVTTVDAPAGTASGLTWGIGGKRATFGNVDSRHVFAEGKGQWTVETETDQTIGAEIVVNPTNTNISGDAFVVQGATGSRKTITQTANARVFSVTGTVWNSLLFRRLRLVCTDPTGTNANGVDVNGSNNRSNSLVSVEDCTFGDPAAQLNYGILADGALDRWRMLTVDGCTLVKCRSGGVRSAANVNSRIEMVATIIADCGGDGLFQGGPWGAVITNSIVTNNAGRGVAVRMSNTSEYPTILTGNTFHGSSGNAVDVHTYHASGEIGFANNIFSNSSAGFGIGGAMVGLVPQQIRFHKNNAYYVNSSGHVQNATLGTGENAQIDVDPQYTDPAAGGNDLRIGENLKALGAPSDVGGGGLTTSYVDIGGAQREEPAGGGGGETSHVFA